MRIRSIGIRDFKRFASLEIPDIPPEARLVVLVGPNGSGKSSLFEAFNYWFSQVRNSINFSSDYHVKTGTPSISNWSDLMNRIQIRFHGLNDGDDPRYHGEKKRKLFYFRSAYRHEPDLAIGHLERANDVLEDVRRPVLMINSEARVSDNYQRMVALSVKSLYDPEMREVTAGDITDKLAGRVREAMQRVFPDLVFSGLGNPLENGTFLFHKGASRNYQYKNLSGGEKAAFDLLLDFIVKCESFDDTVFCIDEPELHMHTRLQSSLLDELLRQLPDDCQLWIATHSIGMTRRAMELHRASPSEVVFFDFGKRDFDDAQVITPATVDREFWRNLFGVALGDLAELVAPSEIVFCEGRRESSTGKRNPSFDARIYRSVFGSTHPDTEFVPLGGTSEVEQNAMIIGDALQNLLSSVKIWSVFDRDDRSSQEIADLESKGTRVLRRRDLENYLWDDEVLAKLCRTCGNPSAEPLIVSKKNELVLQAQACGRPSDDIKSISGQLYNQVKTILGLTGCGNDTTAFSRDTLAPLITPDMAVYRELEEDVFG